jgi:hypothetical protein
VAIIIRENLSEEWSGEAPQSFKFQTPYLRVSGVRCQVSEKNIEAETCWSEAEIPSEAKRQRETLKPEAFFAGKVIQF